MSNQLATFIAEQIRTGLQRKTITSCSRWAERYRIMGTPFPGPWTFNYQPWLLEMHDAEDDFLVGQKAAQLGFTEWLMNVAFHSMDMLHYDVLYLLPSGDDASDFTAGRFNPALELSPHLKNFFADVNNVGLKRAGNNVLYVRGTKSRSKLKSIPTPVIIYDEVDEMDQENMALAEHRQDGQLYTKQLKVSTPTIEGFGINKDFQHSTQEFYTFKCPSCNRFIEMIFPDSMVITGEKVDDLSVRDSYYICHQCKARLHHEDKVNYLKHKLKGGNAHLVPSRTSGMYRGFHVNQMYSMAKAGIPANFALEKLKADVDITKEQEFYNSKLGITHAVRGAKITDQDLIECTGMFRIAPSTLDRPRTMGIDVGSVLHIVIHEWNVTHKLIPGLILNDLSVSKTIYIGTSSGRADDFTEAIKLFHEYNVLACIVDGEPERRSALQFAQALYGRVLLCDYLYSQTGREAIINEDECAIKVNRTAWMDLALGRFKKKQTSIPVNTPLDFKSHVKEPTRVYKQDKFGNNYGVYVNTAADHYAHACTYSEICLPFAFSIAKNQDIHDLY